MAPVRAELPAGEPFAGGRQEYLYGRAPDGSMQVWRTADSGYTWARWPSVERLVAKGTTNIWMTAAPEAPQRIYLHVAGDDRLGGAKAPLYSLYRSDDGGTTWRLLGRSYKPGQRGVPRDTLPWNAAGDSVAANSAFVSAQPGGYVYVVGGRRRNGRDVVGLWCSRDAGVTWHTAC